MKEETQFKKILSNIKSIKIQGAENVCRAGIQAFLLKPTKSSARKILSVRLTEPLLQNAIKLLLKSKDKEKTANDFLKNLKKAHEKIVKQGSKLIKDNMNIYSHCHSSTVIDILYEAKKQGKKFTVYTSEVEPLLQGRKTARDLAKLKIKVVIMPDLAISEAIKKCDIFFFGADAYTKKFIYNKIGTSIINTLARNSKVKTYSCGVSAKFTKKVKIEKRLGKEVWDERNKNIEIYNPAFDKTKMFQVTGIISELGILKPKQFVKKVSKDFKPFSKAF